MSGYMTTLGMVALLAGALLVVLAVCWSIVFLCYAGKALWRIMVKCYQALKELVLGKEP